MRKLPKEVGVFALCKNVPGVYQYTTCESNVHVSLRGVYVNVTKETGESWSAFVYNSNLFLREIVCLCESVSEEEAWKVAREWMKKKNEQTILRNLLGN